MIRFKLGVILLTALCLVSPPVSGQQAHPGWIGVSFEVRATVGDGRAMHTGVVVTDVRGGSPAAEAGIRPGDILLAINELTKPEELRELSSRLHLSAGDRVALTVERDGRRRSVEVLAAERPADFAPTSTLSLSFSPDSMVESISRAMDSLRVRVATDRRGTFVRVAPPREAVPAGPFVNPGPSTWVQAPFEFYVFRGEQYDSLRQEMSELNEVLADLQLQEQERIREVRRTNAGTTPREESTDLRLRQIRERLNRAASQATSLRAAMVENARTGAAGLSYGPAPRPGAPPVAPEAEEFRPLTPYLLGRNRVAGAEVIDLRPELATYFQVEGGVLVVDVPAGTPAASAGLKPGDVITRIDQVSVKSVDDLRLGLSRAGNTLPISLIRQGVSVQVLLRK